MNSPELIIICAYAFDSERRMVIGKDGKIPWNLPEDMKRFRELTMGNVIIAGRKTFESFKIKPLPNRTNIVLTRDIDYQHAGVVVAHFVEEAIEKAAEFRRKIYVVGGEKVYSQALDLASHLELTELDETCEGDAFFPAIDYSKWELITKAKTEKYSFLSYRRKQPDS
jgi:dihydrofolate reductase